MNKPVVWRLSDMWPFTGGCHYSGECNRFEKQCGACPQLMSSKEFDLSRALHRLKHRQWSSGNMTIVAPSNWIAAKARASSLFCGRPIVVIPTGVDCDQFHPHGRESARRELMLPEARPLVLFGATGGFSDPRKGGDVVVEMIRKVAESWHDENPPGLVVYGSEEMPKGIPHSVPFHAFGNVRDESLLRKIYSACDVFVAPSREENLANSVLEAMACGLPVLSFDVGGMADAVVSGQTGLLAESGDIEGLARGLVSLIMQPDRLAAMSENARALAVSKFSQEAQVNSYLGLFAKLCTRPLQVIA